MISQNNVILASDFSFLSGGTTNQALQKTSSGYSWYTIPSGTISGTATANDILSGYTLYTGITTKITGTIPTKTSSDITRSNAIITIPKGYYASSVTKSYGSAPAKPTLSFTRSTGVATATMTQSAGSIMNSGTTTAIQEVPHTIITNVWVESTNQTLCQAGTYIKNTITLNSTNFSASNIKKGIRIYNTTGTYGQGITPRYYRIMLTIKNSSSYPIYYIGDPNNVETEVYASNNWAYSNYLTNMTISTLASGSSISAQYLMSSVFPIWTFNKKIKCTSSATYTNSIAQAVTLNESEAENLHYTSGATLAAASTNSRLYVVLIGFILTNSNTLPANLTNQQKSVTITITNG